MKTLAIVILNYNGKKHLETYLPSVVDCSDGHDVLVIDNGSLDDSINYISLKFPTVQLIQLKENVGFAQGYNDGLERIKGKYEHYLILNSDVEVSPGYLSPLLSRIAAPTIAAVQPKILSHVNKTRFEHAGASGGFLDKRGFPFCRGRIFDECETDHGQYNEAVPVFWASGAALTIKSKAWMEVNGFDGTFFAHMEEIDLCWRLKNRGYKIGVCGESKIYHIGGGTLDRQSSFKTYLNFRNNLFLILKNHRASALFPHILRRMILDGIAGIRFLFEGNFKYFLSVLKAHFHFYAKFNYYLKLRKSEEKFWKTPNLCGQYRGSILVSFFLKHKQNFQQLDSKLFSE